MSKLGVYSYECYGKLLSPSEESKVFEYLKNNITEDTTDMEFDILLERALNEFVPGSLFEVTTVLTTKVTAVSIKTSVLKLEILKAKKK